MNALQIAYIPVVYLLLVGITIVYIDLREKRIPNKLVLPATATLLITTLVLPFLTGDWLKALLTFVIALAVGSLLTYFSIKGWIGMGDVKLIITMGMALSAFALINWAWLLLIATGITLLVVGYKLLAHTFFHTKLSKSIPVAPYIYLAYTLLVGTIIYTN